MLMSLPTFLRVFSSPCATFLHLLSLDESLGDFTAVDFDVDLRGVLLQLLLFIERPSVPDQVERQQEAQHAQCKESNIDLVENTRN